MINWINTKERMPPKPGHYLVYIKASYEEFKIAQYIGGQFLDTNLNLDNITKWVTHWTKLEPPK